MKPISSDRYATEVVWTLKNVHGVSQDRAIKLVNGAEVYVRRAYESNVKPSFVARRIAAGRVSGSHLKADARDLQTMKKTVSRMIARDKKEKKAGRASGRSSDCAPWIPPIFASPEVAHALERAASAPDQISGHIFGGKRASSNVPTKGIKPGVVTNKAGSSWTKGGAKYVSSSKNSKIGDMDATWVSIQSTCVDCTWKEAEVCYAMGGRAALHAAERDEAARANRESSTDTSKSEADVIDSAYNGGPIPAGRILRIHASGDTSTPEGARFVGTAVARWRKRGGEQAYTYTHAWRRVRRREFGSALSVLASLDNLEDAKGALAAGYGSVTVLVQNEDWARRMVITKSGALVFKFLDLKRETGTNLKFMPCPAQYPTDKEAKRWKIAYLARAIGMDPAKAEKVFKVDFDQYGLPKTESNKAFAEYAEAIVRAGFPHPSTKEFKTIFRNVDDGEAAQCVKCELCFDDQKLGRMGLAIAFRPDKSGGVVEAESLLTKMRAKKIIDAAAE